MDAGRLLYSLDAQQREAVVTAAAPLAIIASAGSGKTTVLTRRIAYRVATGTADPRHVLALTFTREAAGELRRRIRRLDLREPIEAGTFHAVALRLLRDRATARNQTPPNVVHDRGRLMRDALAELRLRIEPGAAMADIDWARARRVAVAHFGRAGQAARRRPAIPADRFADVLAAYTKHKRRRGVVDFDDLLEQMLMAMADQTFAEVVAWRFRHFFVDEAQDLNPLQFAVLESWRAGRADICMVGDPRQAIYGWNGADPRLLADVETHLPGITVVHLTSNYRCSPQVVRAGAAVLDAVGVTDLTVSRAGDGPAVAVTVCADEADEASTVATAVAAQTHIGSPSDVAVLARTNEQLLAVAEALTARRIPVAKGAMRSPYERVLAAVYRCTTRGDQATWVAEHAEDPNAIVRQVAVEVDRYLASNEPGTLRAWIDARQPFDIDGNPDTPAVTLTTFHGAKGREWDMVVAIGVNDGLAPHSSAVSHDQLAEEARLLYVALTRAKWRLLVTATEQRREAPAIESPWLGSIRRAATADRPAAPPQPRPQRAVDPLAELKRWRSTVARGAMLDEQAICSDQVLQRLAAEPPGDLGELADRLGITISAAGRLPPLPATPAGAPTGASGR